MGSSKSYELPVLPGDSYLISLRARDETGNYSGVASTTWTYPTVPVFIDQPDGSGSSDDWGTRPGNYGDHPGSASYQSITPDEDFSFNRIDVVTQIGGSRHYMATFQLAVYENDSAGNAPDFSAKVAEAFGRDGTFRFDPGVPLSSGEKYWLVLSVYSYDDSRGWYYTVYRNTISSSDPYAAGEAGSGPSFLEECTNMDYCQMLIPSPAGGDWQMKIMRED